MENIPFSSNPLAWLAFIGLIILFLIFDLLVLKDKNNQMPSIRQSLKWSFFWISLAILFNFGLWTYLYQTVNPAFANQKALEFFSGYLLEKSLSVDNVFVFVMIFSFFKIQPQFQRKILLLGILGAIILRFIMIFGGILLIHQFEWILYIFGVILIYSGFKLCFLAEHENDLNQNKILQFLRSYLPITPDLYQDKLIIRVNKKIFFTPLFLVLCFIEISDVIFAIDSIPAIFGVTRDPFIVFTSNIFAILGLRALYFLFASITNRFTYLKFGIAVILIFIGIKMLIVDWYKISVIFSLFFIVLCLAISIGISLFLAPKTNSETNT